MALELPKTVIFDLDNTLYDYDVANNAGKDSLSSFLSSNFRIKGTEISVMMSESRKRVKERLGYVASSHSRLLYVREFLNVHGFYAHSTFALEAEQVFWRGYFEKMKLFSGVDEFISRLRLAGTKTLLVTDLSTQIQLRKLAWLGLDKAFDLIITSEEAGGDKQTGKPQELISRYINFSESFWCIGDNDIDNLFPESSIFFKKVYKGKFIQKSHECFEFSSFQDFLSQISRWRP